MTHKELVQRGARWLQNQPHYNYRSPIILPEFSSFAIEIPDIIGMSHFNTTIIECKISLTDFKADLKKNHRCNAKSLGNWRFYLCPVNLIPVDIVPEDWGLLYCHNKNISIVKHPLAHREADVRAEEYHLLYSIARRAKTKGVMPIILAPLESNNHNKIAKK